MTGISLLGASIALGQTAEELEPDPRATLSFSMDDLDRANSFDVELLAFNVPRRLIARLARGLNTTLMVSTTRCPGSRASGSSTWSASMFSQDRRASEAARTR